MREQLERIVEHLIVEQSRRADDLDAYLAFVRETWPKLGYTVNLTFNGDGTVAVYLPGATNNWILTAESFNPGADIVAVEVQDLVEAKDVRSLAGGR